jgi:hypothetical protein
VATRVDEPQANKRIRRENQLLKLSVLLARLIGGGEGTVVDRIAVDETGLSGRSDGGLWKERVSFDGGKDGEWKRDNGRGKRQGDVRR